MSEESTTPDLVELTGDLLEAVNRGNFDAVPRFYAPDAVWNMAPWGLGTYEGPAAIRTLNEDWLVAYEEWEMEPEEILDLGSGVVLPCCTRAPALLGALATPGCAKQPSSYGSRAWSCG